MPFIIFYNTNDNPELNNSTNTRIWITTRCVQSYGRTLGLQIHEGEIETISAPRSPGFRRMDCVAWCSWELPVYGLWTLKHLSWCSSLYF